MDNYQKLSGSLKYYFEYKISEQLHLSELPVQRQQYILNHTKGIYIEPNSESSVRLSEVLIQEPDFIEIIKNNKQNILNGGNAEGSIKFRNRNFYYALGKVDIKLNKNGDLTLLVTDVYDFNRKSDSLLIQAAREQQEDGRITPYFIIYDVVIPKSYL